MPALREFVIEEIASDDGTVTSATRARFVWTVANRAAPRGEWTHGLKLNTVRTDYPGSDGFPTEQVLGWSLKPQTIEGVFDDRWLGAGNATATVDAFRSMVKRGNLVKVMFETSSFVALVTDFDATKHNEQTWDYKIELSPHAENHAGKLRRPPVRSGLAGQDYIRTPDEYYERLAGHVDLGMSLHTQAPSFGFGGSFYLDLSANLDVVVTGTAQIRTVLDARTDYRVTPVDTVRNCVALFDGLQANCTLAADTLVTFASDDVKAWDDPVLELQYEVWSRGVAAQMRLAALEALTARIELSRRTDPTVLAIYRASANESLYAISRSFYGEPLEWRRIADRNRLEFFNLQGGEVLVIPRLDTAVA